MTSFRLSIRSRGCFDSVWPSLLLQQSCGQQLVAAPRAERPETAGSHKGNTHLATSAKPFPKKYCLKTYLGEAWSPSSSLVHSVTKGWERRMADTHNRGTITCHCCQKLLGVRLFPRFGHLVLQGVVSAIDDVVTTVLWTLDSGGSAEWSFVRREGWSYIMFWGKSVK